MKNLTLLIASILLAINLRAQITLENTYTLGGPTWSVELQLIYLPTSGFKYSLLDIINSQIIIYNLNHTIFKTINIPTQTEFFGLFYVSETLFDTDSNTIEYIIQNQSTSPTIIKIYSEDSLLFSLTGHLENGYRGTCYGPIFNTDSGTKMILDLASTQIQVYSLPGKLICGPDSCCRNGAITGQKGFIHKSNNFNLSNTYPNPSNNFTKIDYQLPKGVNKGEIIFYDINGKEIKRYSVDNTFNTLLINNSDLPAGTYMYHLVTKNGGTMGKKMIIIK